VGPLLTRRVIDVAIPAGDTAMIVRAVLLFVAALVTQFAFGYIETLLTGCSGSA
jgi:hypothetical protein